MARRVLNALESLPVELIADILGELDLSSLVTVSYVSNRLRAISSEPSLNPWRRPILRTLQNPVQQYDPALRHLGVRTTVPRNNFVEILSIARANYLLFEASLPNLKDSEWEECFRRRFLPSWAKVKKEGATWKEAFVKVLYRIWHRTTTACTHEEAWTDYVVLNRNGTANQLNSTSRGFDPLTIFEQMRIQNDLMQFQPRIRVVVEFADARVLAIGVLSKPRTSFGVNHLAKALLHPSGIDGDIPTKLPSLDIPSDESDGEQDHIINLPLRTGALGEARATETYRHLSHPLPTLPYENYPFFTPSGEDLRWLVEGDLEEGGMQWMWGMMLVAQLIGQNTKPPFGAPPPLDLDLVEGMSRSHYASLTFDDLKTIAPWIEPSKWIEGAGLGHDE
ncbi:hypothetical protein DAEQUDRAFT_723958 [Daedalea quercina L-15889]|uniref:F-box domain-containing protein n=1 Tax=Daedalea quercina L-15889 TaxID=1314783 RepID=A0A165S2H6_9APHY|nr:hypothetical protein DAEQUDRAFT_723958 [Daedalea quercina L-15889]